MNFTKQGQHKEGYARKKKTKKTQKVEYADDDNHPVQSRIFSHGGVGLDGDSMILNLYKHINEKII